MLCPAGDRQVRRALPGRLPIHSGAQTQEGGGGVLRGGPAKGCRGWRGPKGVTMEQGCDGESLEGCAWHHAGEGQRGLSWRVPNSPSASFSPGA